MTVVAANLLRQGTRPMDAGDKFYQSHLTCHCFVTGLNYDHDGYILIQLFCFSSYFSYIGPNLFVHRPKLVCMPQNNTHCHATIALFANPNSCKCEDRFTTMLVKICVLK